jgi:hypothetical protein
MPYVAHVKEGPSTAPDNHQPRARSNPHSQPRKPAAPRLEGASGARSACLVPPRPPYGGRHRTIPDRACFAAIVYMAPHLDSLAATARPRAWLRVTGDVLAPPGRVGRRRRVRPAPPRGARPARRARPAGLVAGERGHHERARRAWGNHVGANSVDRGKPGSKLHLVCDGGGLPLTAAPTVPTCGGVGSGRGSPAVGSSRRPGWVAIAGESSGRCPG